jgi:hypothetical protein
MNVFSRLAFTRTFLLLTATFICLKGAVAAQAPSDSRTKEASDAATQWLAEIDANKLETSYSQGCTAFHNKVTEQQWITVLRALRPSYGNPTNRTEQNAEYKPDGFEGTDGECVVIKYATTFSVIGPVQEIVVMKREDGQWRGAGYNVQPQSSAAQ